MKNKIINAIIIVGLGVFISGCTAIHRVRISPLDNDINSIDKIQLDNVFIDNGYGEGPWKYETIFYPAHIKGQILVGYWGKTHYHKNKKRGGTDAWVVIEGQNLVVYIIGGSRDVFGHTEEFVEDFSVRLPPLYPNANISLSKKYFFDVR